MLDVAEEGAEDDVLALLGRAFQRGITTEASLRRLLASRARHRRRALLVEVLADVDAGAHSAMEVRYVHDVGYDEQRVLVELDGRLGHDRGKDRVHDGTRDRRGAGSGWLTVRAFWGDVAVHPCALEVEAVLTDRGLTQRLHRCRRPGCVVTP